MKEKLFLALLEASSIHKKRSRQGFQELDLSTGQPKVLYILKHIGGGLQKDLANQCQVEPPTMTSLLNNMEKKELIRKEAKSVSGGKRAYYIFLTDKGKEYADHVDQIVDNLEIIGFYGFSDEEKVCLLTLLERVIKNLENESFHSLEKIMNINEKDSKQ